MEILQNQKKLLTVIILSVILFILVGLFISRNRDGRGEQQNWPGGIPSEPSIELTPSR